MYVFVDGNSYNKSLGKKLEKENLVPVKVYSITYEDKKQAKKELEQLLETLQKEKNLALRLFLNKTDNYLPKFIELAKEFFDIVIGYGGLNKMNRYLLEQTKIDFLQDPHSTLYKNKIDFIHHFNSGLNHILCKFAKEKKKGLFISLNCSNEKGKNFAKNFGRINQNLKLANKYAIPVFLSFIISSKYEIKNKKEHEALMKLFNVSTTQIKENLSILEKTIKINREKKEKTYIRKGIIEVEDSKSF